jgi:hypothetical protein
VDRRCHSAAPGAPRATPGAGTRSRRRRPQPCRAATRPIHRQWSWVSPSRANTWILDQLVGTAAARDIGDEAFDLKLLNRYVPDTDVLRTSIELATSIAANNPKAVREVKRLLTTIRPRPMTEIVSSFGRKPHQKP